MKLLRKAGATSEVWQIFIADSSSTTGAGLAGLAFNTSSLTAYYHRDTDTTATAITLATMTVGTFTSSGFKEIDATNMPGWYQFCPPNAALASGAKSCGFHLKGATNMAPLPIEVDLQGDVNVTHIGGTAQTARDLGASVLLSSGTGTGQLDFTSGVVKANVTQLLGTAWLTPGTAGTPDVNAKLHGGTSQTGRDIGASVLLSAGTGTGQLDFTSGVVKANATQWLGGTIPAVNVTGVPLVDAKYLLGTIFSTPTVAGIPNVNCKTWNDLTTVALPLVPTTAGRTLDVSAGGEAGVDWANVGSPTTTLALTGTTIATTQKVDIETIKTNPVVNAGTVTFPTTATLASTTNITAGTITTATNVTTVNGLAANVITAASMAADASAEIATAVWQDTTAGDFTVAASIGKSVMNGVALGTGLTINGYTGNTVQTGDSFARIGANGAGLTNIGTIATCTNLTNAATSGDFTATMKTSLNAATPAATIGAGGITAATFAAGAIDAAALAADAGTEIATAVWAATTRQLSSAGLDLVLVESGIAASSSLTNDASTQLTSINARQALALCSSVLCGVLSGAATTTNTIKAGGNASSNSRIVGTVDSSGNRTALTIKVPT